MSIVGRVTERFYVPDNAKKLAVAQGYKRDPGDPEWPFGREVTLMEIRGGNYDFEINPNAQEVPGHAKLLFDHCNDFAEFTGWQD